MRERIALDALQQLSPSKNQMIGKSWEPLSAAQAGRDRVEGRKKEVLGGVWRIALDVIRLTDAAVLKPMFASSDSTLLAS